MNDNSDTNSERATSRIPIGRILGRQTFSAQDLTLHVRRHVLDGAHQPHDHDFMEIALIFGGSGLHCTIYGEEAVREGDVFLLRPGAWHDYRQCRGLQVYNCCFGLDLWRRDMACLHHDPTLHYLFWAGPSALLRRGLLRWHLSPQVLKICLTHLSSIEVSQDNSPVGSSIERIGHLLLLMSQLAQHMEERARVSLRNVQPPHAAVEEAAHLLQTHCEQEWTLSELARRVHLDRSYLVRLFKQELGLSPMAYLTRCRLERAAGLLLRSSHPITEVAAAVGWPDPNYFARRFRAHFGVSATTYRHRSHSTP